MIENDFTLLQKTNRLSTPFENRYRLSACSDSRTGSIERLVDGDKRVIATKNWLPENNINVVVR